MGGVTVVRSTDNEIIDLLKELMRTNERQHHESIDGINKSIDELKNGIAEQKRNIEQQRQQIDMQTKSIEKLEDRVTYFSGYINETVQPTIQFLTDLKIKGASLLCVLGFLFSTITYYIWTYWEKITKFLNAIK